MKATLYHVPEGIPAVAIALEHMAEEIRNARRNLTIRETAARIVAGCAPKHWACEVTKIFRFVQRNIRYLRDVRDVELIQTPVYTLENRCGDCGQVSMLVASMLESIGHKTRLVAIGTEPGIYCHVYAQVWLNRWITLDCSETGAFPGWEPGAGEVFETMIVEV